MPANAGIQVRFTGRETCWIPAFAGRTESEMLPIDVIEAPPQPDLSCLRVKSYL